MEYTEKDLVKIAKRENNTKRNYLVVDPLQGKHIPVAAHIQVREQRTAILGNRVGIFLHRLNDAGDVRRAARPTPRRTG